MNEIVNSGSVQQDDKAPRSANACGGNPRLDVAELV
jgi:hypothetical protein